MNDCEINPFKLQKLADNMRDLNTILNDWMFHCNVYGFNGTEVNEQILARAEFVFAYLFKHDFSTEEEYTALLIKANMKYRKLQNFK